MEERAGERRRPVFRASCSMVRMHISRTRGGGRLACRRGPASRRPEPRRESAGAARNHGAVPLLEDRPIPVLSQLALTLPSRRPNSAGRDATALRQARGLTPQGTREPQNPLFLTGCASIFSRNHKRLRLDTREPGRGAGRGELSFTARTITDGRSAHTKFQHHCPH